MNQLPGVAVQCSSCGKTNSIPSGFKGGKASCQHCGEFLQNPQRILEIEGYNHIRRGIATLILFYVLIFSPVVYYYFDLTLFDEDEEEEDTESELYTQDSGDACDPQSDDYDKQECERDREFSAILLTGGMCLFLSLPIYGLVQISIGVSKLSKFNTTQF